MAQIKTLNGLREIYDDPKGRSVEKEVTRLDHYCRLFIQSSPFLMMATSNGQGATDVSPRGGPKGFVQIHDDHTLLLGDHIGNNRLDSLENLLSNPQLSLIFMIPGVNETLRICGQGEIHTPENWVLSFPENEHHKLKSVLVIRLETAFLHCAKALMRSALWSPDTAIKRSDFPTMGEMIKAHTGDTGPIESQAEMEARYREQLD